MPSLVVPFRGLKGKSRLGPLPGKTRAALATAMLDDVVDACTAVGATFVVGPDEASTGARRSSTTRAAARAPRYEQGSR